MAQIGLKQSLKGLQKNKLKTGTQVSIAGAAIATAILSEHFGGDILGLSNIKDLPEATKVLMDDGVPLHKFLACKVPPNPNTFFADMPVPDDSFSPVTLDYLKSRRKKKRVSAVIGMAGIASSPFAHGFNPVGGTRETNAVASTLMHMVKLGAIGWDHRTNADVVQWIAQIEVMKGSKSVIRGGKLLGALFPTGSAWAAVGAEAAKLGVDFAKETMCKAVAAEIHYAAMDPTFDQTEAGAHTAARAIVRELFTRRGVTRVLGSYNVERIIHEPGGWLAIADKISLI